MAHTTLNDNMRQRKIRKMEREGEEVERLRSRQRPVAKIKQTWLDVIDQLTRHKHWEVTCKFVEAWRRK